MVSTKGFLHFNPLPPHGGRLDTTRAGDLVDVISIHSLRMEGDRISLYMEVINLIISIHSLRMEGDLL